MRTPTFAQESKESGLTWILIGSSVIGLRQLGGRVLDQLLVRGNKFIWEVAFFHKPSKTLLLVDLIENFTDQTSNVNWLLKLWWKVVFHMWDQPKPAPEYQMGWKDKSAARKSLQTILEWDFEKIVVSHGDLIETNAKAMALEAWKKPLSALE